MPEPLVIDTSTVSPSLKAIDAIAHRFADTGHDPDNAFRLAFTAVEAIEGTGLSLIERPAS